MNTDFSRIITLLRKEKKISQKQAAADLGVSQALLSHYEKGIRECGLEFLVRTADYYGVSCDYLLGRCAEPYGSAAQMNGSETTAVSSQSHKRISDSEAVLFALLEKSGSDELTANIEQYLSLSVYRVFRVLYGANAKNDRRFFTVSEISADGLALAAMERSRALSAALVCDSMLADMSITTNSLTEEYPEYVSSLLNEIKRAEGFINQSE
ncbi:MAG: helix-turn-helix transcriptional regulator [Oscillospiraceae bacterium]|nr:helix-turn-helix transcriptional regulator [Oscillospiraceae bacterium]